RGYKTKPFDPDRLSNLSEKESRALLRALGVAGFAAANVMLLSVSVWSGTASDMAATTQSLFHWVSALIALPAVAYAGQPFFRSALEALRRRVLNMDVPISLAVVLAAAMSLFQTISGGEDVYFDASVSLLFFLLLGRYLDRQMRARAGVAAENLLSLRAQAAKLIKPDGSREVVALEEITPGMRVAVAPGERFPIDGKVLEGRSDIDMSLINGESLPRNIEPGGAVFAGTTNLTGALEIEVTARDDETMLAEIVRLMEAAEQGRARYVRLADRFARIYAPGVHLLGLLTFLFWLTWGGAGWETSLINAIAVLIVTCPCALGLAVPAVQVVASGRLLARGILIKSADGLERLADIDCIVFDKTGTLTKGAPCLVDPEKIPEEDLELAASLALQSNHPLSRALVRAARPGTVSRNVKEVPGQGLLAECAEGEIRLGRRNWCGLEDRETAERTPVDMELWFKRPEKEAICFRFQDKLRSDVSAVMEQLRGEGYELWILSGDREAAVKAAAESLGIESWRAEATPGEKTALLEALSSEGKKVLMVGDGLNDAPALAAAHASLSPSDAADISQNSADLVFQGEKLAAVPEALATARRSRKLILQNFSLALFYNAIAVPLAMAGLVTPLIAALAMSASSIAVTGNALRLKIMGRGG
ncbi:MAG: heavy metal translocating P-type ATPase, partial [Kiloniellales bacterium]|nr:heavy metal translocating P-type ATPase [Kiloniellales bacterium]